MDSFEWRPAYSVGNEVLDSQHKVFFDICRRVHLMPISESAESRDSYIELLDEAVRYARSHFHVEEYFLRKNNYPDLEGHVAEHREFNNQLAAVVQEAAEGKVDNRQFAVFLAHWLKAHILEEDMRYRSLFE